MKLGFCFYGIKNSIKNLTLTETVLPCTRIKRQPQTIEMVIELFGVSPIGEVLNPPLCGHAFVKNGFNHLPPKNSQPHKLTSPKSRTKKSPNNRSCGGIP